ncbi:MAG: aromatic ring-hydroxylating oxygenase subunit alpha [Rhizomicrobium sp.]
MASGAVNRQAFAFDEEIAALGAEPIPAAPYYDPEYYQLEAAAIFRRSWLQIGHVCELSEPGSFIVRPVEVGKTSILVTRGPDGVIRAFHNVCTHRGSKLVQEASGKRSAFSCPYHMWNFGYDGQLRAAPDFESFYADKSKCGLKAVAVDVCAGLIFINLDRSPSESLRDYLGPLADRIETFAVARATGFTEYVYDIDANWKLIMDNFQENYHLRYVHARTGGGMPPDNPFGYPAGFGFMGAHRTQTMRGGGGLNPGPVQGIGMRKIMEFAAADGLIGGPYSMDYCVFFPNLFVFGSGMSPFSLYVMPIAPDRSRGVFRFYWIGDDDSASRRFAREFLAMMMRDLHAEDLTSIVNSQVGLASGALDHIHFQAQEVLCRHLFRSVNDRVEAYKAERRSSRGAV